MVRGTIIAVAVGLVSGCRQQPDPESPPPKIERPLQPATKADDVHLSFDREPPGTLPAGLKTTETMPVGTPAKWGTVADGSAPTQPNAFGILESKNVGGTLNLALVDGRAYEDVEISVAIRAAGGHETVGGGVVWRLRDPDNYYVARWKRNNVRVYVVAAGHRTRIASADVSADPNGWHTLAVTMESDRIAVSFDGGALLDVDDSTHLTGGNVGLWTQADAVTVFDDLAIGSR